MGETYWLEADYVDSFKCKCGSCRHTCCGGWRIAVSEDEYFRIIGMDCSQRLHEKIEGAFVRPDFPTRDRYMLMEADWTGRCRMLDSDGMCMLQKECGESAITEVCRMYPRSFKSENGVCTACCSASCEAVAELLMRREKLGFVRKSSDEFLPEGKSDPEFSVCVDYDVNAIFDKVIKVLQDRSMTLVERIAEISKMAGTDPEENGIAVSVRNNGFYATVLPIISEFCEEARSLQPYADEFADRYSAESFDEEFARDRRCFEEKYPDWSCYFENLLCNNMLYSAFPAVDRRVERHKAVLGLSLQYTLLRVICIAHTAQNGWTQEALTDAIAEVYHVVEHTAFYFNAVVLLDGARRNN